MAQPPPLDDLGVFEIPEKIHHERVLTRDLAAFLGVSVKAVNAWASKRDCLHNYKIAMRSMCKIRYVTPFIAARAIVYFRAEQEAEAMKKRRVKADASGR